MTMGDRIPATRRPGNNRTDPTPASTKHTQPRRTDPEATKTPPRARTQHRTEWTPTNVPREQGQVVVDQSDRDRSG